ncbi:MAG TPA: methyltransferase domain-containing protein [Pseudolabrys sp.]|nr:methyltransferase domain-containing protein [Pseudolabrys sp.]
MSTSHAEYSLGGTEIEKQRLLTQVQPYEPMARELLERVQVKSGWRVADIGCGPIGILNLLSEAVGSQGQVFGVEREARFAAMAREEAARRGLQNVTIVQADGFATGLSKGTLDMVHERLVLMHVPNREAFVAEMLSLLRPGGTIALEDVDNSSWLCHPAHDSWTTLFDAFHEAFHKSGGDGFLGRRLPGLLRTAGIQDVKTKIYADVLQIGDYRRTHLISLIDSIRGKIVEAGVLSDDDLERHKRMLADHLANPATTVVEKLLVQSWGVKP